MHEQYTPSESGRPDPGRHACRPSSFAGHDSVLARVGLRRSHPAEVGRHSVIVNVPVRSKVTAAGAAGACLYYAQRLAQDLGGSGMSHSNETTALAVGTREGAGLYRSDAARWSRARRG